MTETAIQEGPPAEAWERLRDQWRARIADRQERSPGLGAALARAQAVALWTAVLLVLLVLAFAPDYRPSLWVFLCCWWILLLWFAVARTKSLTWAGTARVFSFGIVWSWVVAWVCHLLVGVAGSRVTDAGPGIAIAAFTEESLTVAPLAVLALIAPGRVRRFAATDWLLLGFVLGLGFQAWEDLLRRLALQVGAPERLAVLVGADHGATPEYGFGLLSGGSGWTGWTGTDDVVGYAGHHVLSGLIAGALGLGLAVWRAADGAGGPRARAATRIAAVALPVLAWFVAVTVHVGFAASLRGLDRNDAGASVPWPLRAAWPLLGKGTGIGWLLLAVLLACLLVDAHRLHAAGARTDLIGSGRVVSPRAVTDRWTARLTRRLPFGLAGAAPVRGPVSAAAALVAFAGRDLVAVLALHTPEPRTGRREAMRRGRDTVTLLRQIRTDAYDHTVPGTTPPPSERICRNRVRLVAALTLFALALFATVVAVTLARHLGTDPTPGDGAASWLAGQFDAVSTWWAGLNPAGKLLAGAVVAALVGLSGGSLGLGAGGARSATDPVGPGRGLTDLTRDPVGTTRSWLSTTTPAEAALDLAGFGLTLAPGRVAAAGVPTGTRAAILEYADDPAQFWALRREALAERGDVGSIGLEAFYGSGAPRITEAGLEHALSHLDTWFGPRIADATTRAQWRALIERAARSRTIVAWSVRGRPTYLHLTRVDGGRHFAVQFDRTTHELVTAFRPDAEQLEAILRRPGA